MDEIMVVAVPDDKFYTNRTPGEMHPLEEAKINASNISTEI
jgi:hypothetical protein